MTAEEVLTSLALAARQVAKEQMEAARVALLVELGSAQPREALEALLAECYRAGDNGEKCAVLRSLPLMPEPERFVAIGTQGCRTHVLAVFEAIACENPYPAACFPELAFNQMVLKALFMGVSLDRVIGLRGRLNPELARMARDYAAERRAAGRSVPDDIHCVALER